MIALKASPSAGAGLWPVPSSPMNTSTSAPLRKAAMAAACEASVLSANTVISAVAPFFPLRNFAQLVDLSEVSMASAVWFRRLLCSPVSHVQVDDTLT